MDGRFARTALLAVALALPSGAAGGGEAVAIVTADRSPRTEIAELVLRRIYLGKLTRLDGTPVEPFHLPPGTEARRRFSLHVLGQSEEALDRYWVEQALTGGRIPPREVSSVENLLALVAAHPGRIGYAPLSAARQAAGIRVLRIVSGARTYSPDEADYPIRLPDPLGPPPTDGLGARQPPPVRPGR
jgi:hypothetical protein